MSEKFIDLFIVFKHISNIAYELQLPANIKIYPVFHMSLLEKYTDDSGVADTSTYKFLQNKKYEIKTIVDFKISINTFTI